MISEPYNDNTYINFGMHKGKKLCNVPASYLLYLWDNNNQGEGMYDRKLAAYIKDNLSGLRMEVISEKQRKRYETR
jgi:uncharacterized protein (DUF3820 family)